MVEADMALAELLADMPDLLPAGYPDSDSEFGSDMESESDSEPSDSGNEGDVEEEDVEWVDELDGGNMASTRRLSQQVQHTIQDMYAHRYQASRKERVPPGPAFLPHVLHTLKIARPDHFRDILRVNPTTFDKIVDKIKDDPVFFNNSNNAQLPVEEQLAITLYRFGHDGNGASQAELARWAGGGKGAVSLHTKRVMTAILRPGFMNDAVRMPTPDEKEEAKEWVEAHSCKAWRDGWCLVDGTLVPLYDRPHWYGESYFDRKCNYSLNIQVHFIWHFTICCADVKICQIRLSRCQICVS